MKAASHRINANVLVVAKGKVYHSNCVSEHDYQLIKNLVNDYNNNLYTDSEFNRKIQCFFMPETDDTNDILKYLALRKSDYNSILFKRNNSYYMKGVSELSIPLDLVKKIYEAEDKCDTTLIQTYKNFWTLVSLNPDSRVRNDLFTFINTWNIKIAKSGLLIMYRNADLKTEGSVFTTKDISMITQYYDHIKYVAKKSPKNYFVKKDANGIVSFTKDEFDSDVIGDLYSVYTKIINDAPSDQTPVYTDHHSHKFTIKLGTIVSMPREDCNADQTISCSTGLIVAQ